MSKIMKPDVHQASTHSYMSTKLAAICIQCFTVSRIQRQFSREYIDILWQCLSKFPSYKTNFSFIIFFNITRHKCMYVSIYIYIYTSIHRYSKTTSERLRAWPHGPLRFRRRTPCFPNGSRPSDETCHRASHRKIRLHPSRGGPGSTDKKWQSFGWDTTNIGIIMGFIRILG